MTTQVITIEPNGAVSGLQKKPGQGLDLRKLGKAVIQRASDIRWDEERQQWYVQVLRGKYAGTIVHHGQVHVSACYFQKEAVNKDLAHSPDMTHTEPDSRTAFYDDYDEAVQAEIMFLDYVRLTEGPDALQD